MNRAATLTAVAALTLTGCGAPPVHGDGPVCQEARTTQQHLETTLATTNALPEDKRASRADDVADALGAYRAFGRDAAGRVTDPDLRAALDAAADAGVSAAVGPTEAERHFAAFGRVLDRCRQLGH